MFDLLHLENETHRFVLGVVSYQYPDKTVDEYGYDINWLRVGIDVRTPDCAWRVEDPSLLTWELVEFAAWLRALAGGDVREAPLFVEPVVRFDLPDPADAAVLRVRLRFEALPPGVPKDQEVTLEFRMTREDYEAAARAVEALAVRFPQRETLAG